MSLKRKANERGGGDHSLKRARKVVENASEIIHFIDSNDLDSFLHCIAVKRNPIDLVNGTHDGLPGSKSPLQHACRHGLLEMTKELLQEGANPFYKDKEGQSALHEAAVSQNLLVIETLLRWSSKATDGSFNFPGALSYFVQKVDGNSPNGLKIFRLLLDHCGGEKGQKLFGRGQNLVHLLCRYERLPYLEEIRSLPGLVDLLKEEDEMGRTPFLLSVKQGVSRPFLECLLSLNADLRHTDLNGKAPLHYAAETGNVELMDLLAPKEHINRGSKQGITPLMSAVDSPKAVEKLLELGADVLLTDVEWQNVFHKAVCVSNGPQTIQILREKVGEGKMCQSERSGDRSGATPLHIAAAAGNILVFELYSELLETLDLHGQTPIFYAARNDKADAVDALVNMGASLFHKDEDGTQIWDLAKGKTWTSIAILALAKYPSSSSSSSSSSPSFCSSPSPSPTTSSSSSIEQEYLIAKREFKKAEEKYRKLKQKMTDTLRQQQSLSEKKIALCLKKEERRREEMKEQEELGIDSQDLKEDLQKIEAERQALELTIRKFSDQIQSL